MSDFKTPFTGGCLCGAVRYECTAPLTEIQMFRCHCRSCQRLTGGPYTPVVFFPAHTFRVTRGTLRRHTTFNESGGEHIRSFCADCGSRLTGGEGEGSTGIGVTASSLVDPSWFKPQVEFWVSDAQPWDSIDPAVPAFEKLPP